MEQLQTNNMAGSNRVAYIDIFRGIAIALMIIVNNQGDWQHVLGIFRHAAWHGFSGADIVFPFFLFIMGASIPLTINASLKKEIPKRSIAMKIVRRSCVLIALGLFINLLPRFDFSTMRIPGVLQRIGLCYGATGLMYLYMAPRNRWIAAIAILTLYSAALLFVGPDGFGLHPLAPHNTICYMIDRALFAGHTYAYAPIAGFDPEGFFSTLPAIVSTMAGFFVIEYIGQGDESAENRTHPHARLVIASCAMIISGIAISPVLPINKNLWTLSYVLFTSGIAIITITLLKIIDERGKTSGWSLPFLWLGINPLFIYIASSAVGKILATTSIALLDGGKTVKALIFTKLFSSWLPPHAASFAYACAFLLIWVAMSWLLYRKGIVVKV